MKILKILLIIFIFLDVSSEAQVIFEHAYDSASTFAIGSPATQNQLMFVKFEVSGERYVKINRKARIINIYNINHSLVKSIDWSAFPFDPTNVNNHAILYLSETLFDLDPGIEFMYLKDGNDPSNCYMGIYNDDGSLIFSDVASPIIQFNVELQQYPIYNTSQGTKMILSYPNGQAKVFGLAGTLSTIIQQFNQNLMQEQGLLSNPAPNPAVTSTQIDYRLPKEANQGEIVFYDQQGHEVKRFKVDNAFNHLLISTADIPAGTYYYQLQTARNISAGKKMVVIK